MTDPKLIAATQLMALSLAGIAARYDTVAGDFTVDEDQGRVTAEIELPSGDVYELSTRWASEKSP